MDLLEEFAHAAVLFVVFEQHGLNRQVDLGVRSGAASTASLVIRRAMPELFSI